MSNNSNIQNIQMLDPYLFLENPLYIDKLMYNSDDKYKLKIIKNIERLIRSSNEYSRLVKYIKSSIQNNCQILNLYCHSLDEEEENNEDIVTIEVHHNLYTLFDLVEILLQYHMSNVKDGNDSNITTFDICRDVILLHYNNEVSLIALSKTMHEYVHSINYIFNTCSDKTIGNPHNFYERYKDYMNDKQLNKYQRYISNEIKNDLQYMISINN